MPPAPLLADVTVPPLFRCPISLDLMRDPVTLCTGVTYDRSSIENWLDIGHNTCPATGRILDNCDLTPNHTLRRFIQQWCVANPSHGIERIPTPKAPIEPRQVQLMLHAIAHKNETLAVLRRLRALAKATDRDRRCIEGSGAPTVLATLIASQASDLDPDATEILPEAVGILVLLSIDDSSRRLLLEMPALACMSRLLLRANTETRVNVAQLLEILAFDSAAKMKAGQVDGIIEGSMGLLRESLYPAAVTAGLKTLLVLSQALRNRIKVLEMNVVPLLVELLPGAEKCRVERVMALLHVLSGCPEGRAAIAKHALAIPSVVKSLLTVSECTNEHALGVLWSVCVHSADEETLHETIQLGTFQKLLLLVQMDCNEITKQKAKDLLRLFSEISSDDACTTSSEEI